MKAWDSWTYRNLRRGVDPLRLRKDMEAEGLPPERIRDLLGEAFYGRRAPNPLDHVALAAPRLTRHNDPNLRRVPTTKAQVYTWDAFLNLAQCTAMIDAIEGGLRNSTTVDPLAAASLRTSKTSDIGNIGHDAVIEVEDQICEALGIAWPYSEVTQGQRYEPGQEYKAHHDFFMPNTPDFRVHTQFFGQRTWTAMIYLNDVEEGGATRFRKLDKMFRPKTGTAVFWNNLNPDGTVNPNTLHHGMKVRTGVKYVITKWFRERGWGPVFPD